MRTQPLKPGSYEWQIVDTQSARSTAVSGLMLILPLNESPFLRCAGDGVVQDEPQEHRQEHAGGEDHPKDVVQRVGARPYRVLLFLHPI